MMRHRVIPARTMQVRAANAVLRVREAPSSWTWGTALHGPEAPTGGAAPRSTTNRDVEHFHSLRLTGHQGARCARIAL
jgi:hypothetical protein